MKIVERVTLHVSDDTGRIAMLENRTYGTAANDNNTVASLTRYIYSNHLQSASLELGGSAAIISYEEYHPYGTTSYQATNAAIQAVAKHYRYTGKERDEESGLYYHGARYYIPWLCRWAACDPLESKYAGMSPYNYSFNNPVVWNDPSGADPGDEKKIPIAPTVDHATSVISPVLYDSNEWSPPEGSMGAKLEEVLIKPDNLQTAPTRGEVLAPTIEKYGTTNGQTIRNIIGWNKFLESVSSTKNQVNLSQGKDENAYERQMREEREYRMNALAASQSNPVFGTFHFAASDVVGTAELGYNSYENYREGNITKGTVYLGLAALGVSGYGGGTGKGAVKLLSEAKLARAINTLREGEEVTVYSIEHARQILHNMSELTPHVNNFPSNAGELFSETPFLSKVWKQPKGTYRGDLINTAEKNYSKFVHDPLDVGKNIDHAYNPHYNIVFPNGKKAAIIVR